LIKLELTQEEFNEVISKKSFDNDIVVGNVGENLFKQYLIKYKKLTFLRKSEEPKDLKKWDFEFLFNDKIFRYEIKTDVFIHRGKFVKLKRWNKEIWINGRDTGNIFIEFYCRGVESGISSTIADIWVNIFFHLNEIWIIPVDVLKNLISENDFKVSEECGDIGSNTKGYLIPREEFRSYFKVVKYELILI
jgi:hypothetical protein